MNKEIIESALQSLFIQIKNDPILWYRKSSHEKLGKIIDWKNSMKNGTMNEVKVLLPEIVFPLRHKKKFMMN